MIANPNISSRLYLLLAFTSLVIIVSGIYGIRKLKELNTITQTIHNDRLMPMKQLFIIRNAYGVELLSIVSKVNKQQLSKQQALTELHTIEQTIRSNWKAYQLTGLTPEEVQLIKEISPLMQEENLIIYKLKFSLQQQNGAPLTHLIERDFYKITAPVTLKINELITLQVSISQMDHVHAARTFETTSRNSYIVILLALSLSIPFGLYLIKGVQRLVGALDLSYKEITESNEKNRALIENIDDGILLINENRDVIYQSPSVERLTGHSFDKRGNINISSNIYHEDHELFNQFLNTVYATPGSTINNQVRVMHKQGHIIWLEGCMVNMLHNPSIQAVIVNYRDVTERKKATELFKYQFENSPDYILIINKDFTIESINKGRPNGPTAAELIGQNAIDVLPEESKESTQKAILDCFNTGENQEIENYIVNGRLMRSRLVPLVIDGVILHLMIIGTDITEKKITEKKLQQSEEKHRALVENISDTIILMNESLEIVYQSPSSVRTSGFTLKDFDGKTAVNFIHPDDLGACFQIIEQSKLNPEVPIQGQFRLLTKAGDYVWVEGTMTNLLLNTSVKAIVVNYRNISERKKLEEQQSLITSIVNSSRDAIISKTLDNRITSWNGGAEKMLGYSEAEIIGQSITSIIPSFLQDEEQLIMNRIKAGKSVDHYETQRKKKNGDLIHVSLTVSPIMDASGNVVGASKVLRDISDQKAIELERERILHDVQQRNRDLEQFSSFVSHNLRGPVATIIGLTDLLKTDSLDSTEKDHMIHGVSNAMSNLDLVIKDLNHILQIRKEIGEKKEQVVFSTLLHTIQSELSSLIQNEQVQFITNFSGAESIRTNKGYLYNIFHNLISNSIKFKQPGTIPVIEISSFLSENKIVLLFKDNGLGIDLSKKGDQVFGLYKRFHLNTEGKGIGLYMVKTQVESLGGAIFIKSKVNTGTEFRIELENE